MWRTLSEFYTSKEWRIFREHLIHERTNKDDGMLYDEYNHKPLLKSYDIILHHKQELTLQNVNDFSISLNPENIMIVSHKSHNEIHNRFGYASGKKVYYVYGAPCSGKNTFVQNVMGNSDLIVDIDRIWYALTGREYYKPNALKACVFQLYGELIDMVKTRQGYWQRAYVIQGGAHKGQRERLIKELGAEPIFINTPKEVCLKRAVNRPEEWKKFIDDWFLLTNY